VIVENINGNNGISELLCQSQKPLI